MLTEEKTKEKKEKFLPPAVILARLERLRRQLRQSKSSDPTPPEPLNAEKVQETNWRIQRDKI